MFEPIDAESAERCYRTVFPGRELTCLAFGMPDLDFDLDANNAEGNGSVATMIDTLGAVTDLARSNNNDVATTTVSVEPATVASPVSNNYGMFTLSTQLDEWATAQNHVDWRVADFQGSTAGAPANLSVHPADPIRTYLPMSYSACGISGCTPSAPQEPVLAASAVLKFYETNE